MTYLVLIDSRVSDIPSIVNSLTVDTTYLVFEYRADVQSIKERITENYESVAIIQHNSNQDVYRLVFDFSNSVVTDLEKVDPDLETWAEYIDFLLWLKNERGANHIDLMACNLWSDANWRYMIETVRSKHNIYIRASLDITGEGGDFILESDNFDTIGVYFTTDILNYKYSFYGIQVSGYPGYINYKNYQFPTSNLGRISSRYSSLVDNNKYYSSTTYNDVVSIISNNIAFVILRSNGTISITEIIAGAAYTGVLSQSDFVNIKKVIGGGSCFVALKNDGTVISWGKIVAGNPGKDINNGEFYAPTDGGTNDFINVDSVRSQLVDIVDIYATNYDAFAAVSVTGRVVTWGKKIRGAGSLTDASQNAFKWSGVTKIVSGVDSFSMLKNDGTALVLGGWGNPAPAYSHSYFSNKTPIVDMFVCVNGYNTLYLMKNGIVYDLVKHDSSGVIYTLPQGVTVLKYVSHPNNNYINHYLLLSNNTVVTYLNNVFSLITNNVTDIETNGLTGGGGAFAMIQNGTVVTSGNSMYGGNLSDVTYGLKSGLNLTNPVRLVSTYSSFGVLKSDNTFVWVGRITAPSNGTYYSGTFPTNAGQTILYDAMSSNVSTVYASYDRYSVIKADGSIAVIGINDPSGGTVTATKDGSMNVYFEQVNTTFYPIDVSYSPVVNTPNIGQYTTSTVSYYVSNPDLMCFVGRKYELYNGATLLDTFYPKYNDHTYVFSNVFMTTLGTYTFVIKDATNITYTIASFSITVVPLTINRWVAAGHSPATGGAAKLAYSKDGIEWSLSSNATSIFGSKMDGQYCVANNEYLWVAGSSVSTNGTSSIGYSYDGKVWFASSYGNAILTSVVSVAYGNNMFVAVGSGPVYNIMYSYDGIIWVGAASGVINGWYNGIVYRKSTWVLFGGSNNASPRTFATSTNAIDWNLTTTTDFSEVCGVDYSDTYWVLVGNGAANHIMYTDDINGTLTASGIGKTIYGSGKATSVAWNGSRFIVTGSTTSGTSPILYSATGTSWTSISSARFNTNGGGIRSVGYQLGIWVMGQEYQTGYATNNILYSLDNGNTWNDASTNVFGANSIVNCVAYMNTNRYKDRPYPCFLQGSKILRMNPETDEEEYVAVEKLRRGDLIKTADHGYKAIELIGYTRIPDPLASSKESRRLYWFRKSKCANAGLFEDLCVTGDHCILHRRISADKRDQVMAYMGNIYATEEHYRVPAFLDDRREPHTDRVPVTIWHFALENPNIYYNYGVLANGLLVESCSIDFMYNHSNMKMI